MRSVGIHYGIIFPSIRDQVEEQGLKVINVEVAKLHEKYRQSILLLLFADVITDTESQKAFERLQRAVAQNVTGSGDGR